MTTFARADKAERQRRVKAVADCLLQGLSHGEIKKAMEVDYGITGRQAQTYIARAMTLLADEPPADRRAAYQVALSRYERIFNAAITSNDFRTALAVEGQRGRLLGLQAVNAPKSPAPALERPADLLIVLADALATALTIVDPDAQSAAVTRVITAAAGVQAHGAIEERLTALENRIAALATMPAAHAVPPLQVLLDFVGRLPALEAETVSDD